MGGVGGRRTNSCLKVPQLTLLNQMEREMMEKTVPHITMEHICNVFKDSASSPLLIALLNDTTAQAIHCNPNGSCFYKVNDQHGYLEADLDLDEATRFYIAHGIASLATIQLNTHQPKAWLVFPDAPFAIQILLPPIVESPAFSMYKTTDDPAKILDVVDSYGTDCPSMSPRQQDFFNILENAEDERPMQGFFEQNPDIFVASKYVVANALISKLPLGNDFVTDFAFVEPTSGGTYLHLIEIESPKIKIFNADDHFSTKYNRAFQQVQDWANWAGRNSNAIRDLFIPLYNLSNSESVPPMFILQCYLIAGRRSELSSVRRQERFQTKRGQMTGGSFTIRTYDGFAESKDRLLRGHRHDFIKCFSYRNRSFVEKV
jgi:Shedu protein SduA, C-terminal